MSFSNNITDEILEKNDIVSVIGEIVELKKVHNEYLGLCPFHNEKTPSFYVNAEKQLYHCFGCSAGGNVLTFVMNYDNLSFKDALEQLANRVGMELPKYKMTKEQERKEQRLNKLFDVNKEAAKYYYYALKNDKNPKARKYLEQRGLSEETIRSFGLGYSRFFRDDLVKYLNNKGYSDDLILEAGLCKKDNNGCYDAFFDRVMFPIFNVKGKVIAFGARAFGDTMPKYLNSKETELFNKSRTLYGLNIARKSKQKYVYLVEGYMDVIALHQAGFNNAVATLGTALTPKQANLIKRYFEKVIICYDSDGAGVKAARRAIPIIKSTGLDVRVLTIKGSKDPDEYIKTFGKEAFEKLTNDSENAFLFEIRSIQKGYDMTDPDAETKFYERVASELLKLSSKVEITNYTKKISDIYGVDFDSLNELVSKQGKDVGIVKSNVRTTMKSRGNMAFTPSKAERILLNLMIEHAHVYSVLIDHIDEKDFNDEINKRIFHLIVEYKDREETIKVSKFVAFFDDIKEQEKVANIFSADIEYEDAPDLERLINECFTVLRKEYIKRLTSEAVTEQQLINLVDLRTKLDNDHISL